MSRYRISWFHVSFTAIALWMALCMPASSMVLWNLENSANQSDPGTGVPWGAVARVAGNTLSLSGTTGTAIHLGGGWMLTANHVTLGSAQRVTFDGVTALTIDMTFNAGTGVKQVAAGVDLKIFRLTADPGAPSVELDAVGAFSVPSTLIGFGVGRDVASPLSTSPVVWGGTATIAKRWGLNRPISIQAVTYAPYAYTALVTVAGSASGDPAGLGDAEAGLTQNDSGAGMFQFVGSEWILVGVGAAVERQAGGNTTTIGDDITTGSTRGDRNFFVPVATYRDAILVAIPEPSSLVLTLPSLAWLASRRQRRSRASKS